jgi:tetratricopeptide (TPR) repeat protein
MTGPRLAWLVLMPGDHRVPGYLGRVLSWSGIPVGTCFQVGRGGVLVTAWHVLDGVKCGYVGARVGVDVFGGQEHAVAAEVIRVDPVHDLAVLRRQVPLPGPVAGLVATGAMAPLTSMVITGSAEVDDPGHEYLYLDATGTWEGGARRDGVVLGRLSSSSVLRGMSGAPVRCLAGDQVAGVVSARYNSADGWLRGTVWVARTEDLAPLLADVAGAGVVELARPGLVSPGAGGSGPWEPGSPEHPGDVAAGLFAAGDLDGAERVLRRWAGSEPGNPVPLRQLCGVYQAASRWEEMIAAARQWQRLNPGDWKPSVWVAVASFELGSWSDAVEGYRTWARHAAGDPEPLKMMWLAAASGQDPEAEMEAADGWIAAAPQDPEAWSSYAGTLYGSGRYAETLEAVTRCLALDPDDDVAQGIRADALYALERWQDATGAYRRSAGQGLMPAAAWARMWVASAHCGDRAAGLAAAAGWSSASPYDPEALSAHVRELSVAGRYEEVIAPAERLMELTPGPYDDILLCDYGVALEITGDYGRLAAFINEWPDTDDAVVMTVKARALFNMERYPGALAAATIACGLDDSVARAWQVRAESAHATGDHEDERDAARRWAEHEPGASAQGVLARSLHETGHFDEALTAIEAGWPGSDQDDPYALCMKAKALQALARNADAVAAASRAIEKYQAAQLFGSRKPEGPFPLSALVVQADCLFQLGNYGGAAAAARQLVTREPGNLLYCFFLTRSLAESGQWDDALEAAELWVKVDSTPAAWAGKTRALLGLRRWEDARKAAEVALAMRPGDPNGLSLASTACAGCKDRQSALAYAEQWLRAAPESQDAREWLELLHTGVTPPGDSLPRMPMKAEL